MPENDYTARQALDLLMARILSASPDLAERIQNAVDSGRDVRMEADEQPGSGRGRRPARRFYRKNVPFTDEEALCVAVQVLESHLIESRMLVNAAHTEF